MEDTPLDQAMMDEPASAAAAPVTDALPQEVPAGSQPHGCLKAATATFSIISVLVSLLVIVSMLSVDTARVNSDGAYADGVGLGMGVLFFLWLPVGALPGAIGCICGMIYGSLTPSQKGLSQWPLIVGALAAVLGLVVLIMFL